VNDVDLHRKGGPPIAEAQIDRSNLIAWLLNASTRLSSFGGTGRVATVNRQPSTVTMAQQTTLDEWAKDPLVDPEIRAHVYSLISAVSRNIPNTNNSLYTRLTSAAWWNRRRRDVCARRRCTSMLEGPAKMAQVRRRTVEQTRCSTLHGRGEPCERGSSGDAGQNIGEGHAG
jgi:hypothetical protein